MGCFAQVPTDFRPKPTLNHPLQKTKLTMPQPKKKGLRIGAPQKADAKRLKAYLKKHGK
jgi:hypothetical protein